MLVFERIHELPPKTTQTADHGALNKSTVASSRGLLYSWQSDATRSAGPIAFSLSSDKSMASASRTPYIQQLLSSDPMTW
jgi:hypothetical protein